MITLRVAIIPLVRRYGYQPRTIRSNGITIVHGDYQYPKWSRGLGCLAHSDWDVLQRRVNQSQPQYTKSLLQSIGDNRNQGGGKM